MARLVIDGVILVSDDEEEPSGCNPAAVIGLLLWLAFIGALLLSGG
jgi:hypothetical protein